MGSILLEYRVRIRDSDNLTDVLVVSSVRGDTLPYLIEPPRGDGAEFDPLTGAYRSGSMTCRIVDAITSGTSRVVTSQLEDANARQQLSGRPAYVEIRENGGAWTNVHAGIVTSVRLPTAAVWEIDVGDTLRATRSLMSFGGVYGEPLATTIARWPNRGCLAGGPVLNGFLGMAQRSGWEFKALQAAGVGSGRIVYLEFQAGYGTPEFKRTTKGLDLSPALNAALGPRLNSYFFGSGITTQFPREGPWPGLVVLVDGVPFEAASIYDFTAMLFGQEPNFFIVNKYANGIWVSDPTSALTVSSTAIKLVHIFDLFPTERCPIYWSGHPVDLAVALCAESNIAVNSGSVTATKAALGMGRRINLRIPAQSPFATFVENTLYGPCGFSAGTDASGALSFFSTRVTSSTAPAITLTSADVPQEETQLFELTEPDAISTVTFNQQNLIPTVNIRSDGQVVTTAAGLAITNPALDGINVQDVRITLTNGDTTVRVQKEQVYTIPGFIDSADAGAGRVDGGYVDAAAKEIFDHYGRGRLGGETTALRGGAGGGVVLGQEIILAVPAMPNHNKRLGDDNTVPGRVVQIVRLTPSPRGPALRYLDSGPNAQTVATVPALSLAAGGVPGSVQVTITNAATLNAIPAGARLQWAQTTGAAPAASAYTDVAAYPDGAIPTGAITLPVVSPGLTVWVRARSEQLGRRPSNYSAGTSLATTAYGAPSALTATPSGTDGSRCVLAWVTGTGAAQVSVDVFARLSADPATSDIRRITLLPGSIAYTLDGLTPGASYTASVQHRDISSGYVSAKSTVTFTAGVTSLILSAPSSPVGFAGSLGADGVTIDDGTYGIQVTATAIPGLVEVWEAVETGIGTGLYGAFAALASPVASVQAGPTRYVANAPNDGLRRRLQARHVRAGCTPSAFSAFVTVLPWAASSAGIGTSGGELLGQCTLTGLDPTANSYQLKCNDTDPGGSTVTIVATTIGTTFSDLTATKTFTIASGSGSATVTILRAAVNGGTTQLKIDYTAPNRVADQVLVDIPAQGQDAGPVVALSVKENGDVQAVISGNNNTASFRWMASTSSMPSDATVRASGTIVNGRTATFTIANLALGQRCYFKLVPYDGTGASGNEGQIVAAEIDRQNQNTSGKRAVFPGDLALPQLSSASYLRSSGTIGNSAVSQSLALEVPLLLTNGTTITGVESNTFRADSADAASVSFFYAPRGGGSSPVQIGSTQTNSTTGAVQLIAQSSLSVTVDTSSYYYYAVVTLNAGAVGQAALYDVAIVYTSPDLSKTL